MLTIELQKELSKELERICNDNQINHIRNLHDDYTFKYSRYTRGSPSFPCCAKCNPRQPNEIFTRLETKGIITANAFYTDIGNSHNNLCFPRCGNSEKYPNCDKDGAIDVRFLGYLEEFKSYYSLRPEHFLRRDSDIHPDSVEIHRILKIFFDSLKEQEIVQKINSIL